MAHWIVDPAGRISHGNDRVCPVCNREFSKSPDSFRSLCQECGSGRAPRPNEKYNSQKQRNYGFAPAPPWSNHPAKPLSFWQAAASTVFGIIAGCLGLFAVCTFYLVCFSDETMTSAMWLSGILAGIAMAISTAFGAFCWFTWTVDSLNDKNPVARAGRIIIGAMGIVSLIALLAFLWSNPDYGASYDVLHNGRYVTTAFIENWEFALLGTIGASLWLLMFGVLLTDGISFFLKGSKESSRHSIGN